VLGIGIGEPVSLDLVSEPARPWRCGATIN
jgi:hypothetical protein